MKTVTYDKAGATVFSSPVAAPVAQEPVAKMVMPAYCSACGLLSAENMPCAYQDERRPGCLVSAPLAAPVAAQAQPEPLHITHAPLMREAASLLRLNRPVTSDFERVASELERAIDGQPTPSGEPSPEWLDVAELAARPTAQDRENVQAPDWMTCESRGPMIVNSLKYGAERLRRDEKRCRGAYKKAFMGVPTHYLADAYGEAAAVFEAKLKAIDAARAAKGADHG